MEPDDGYLLKVGLAHYWFQYVEWNVIYAIHYATGEDVSNLAGKHPGTIASLLKELWKSDRKLKGVASRYEAQVVERNHLAHSHPATQPDGKQRLLRHDIKNPSRPKTIMWIEPEWLDNFIATAQALNRDICRVMNNP